MKIIRPIYIGLAFLIISLMTHGGWSMGFLRPLSVLTYHHPNLPSQNAEELPDISQSLPPLYQKEIQNNPYLNYFQILDDYQKQLSSNSNSTSQLLHITQQLKRLKIKLNQCEQTAGKAIKIYFYEMNLLKNSSSIHSIQRINQNKEYLYQVNRNNIMICRFLKYKIDEMRLQIQQYHEKIYLNSFSKKYNNVLMAFQNFSFDHLQRIPFGFASQQVVYHSRLFFNYLILIFVFFCFYFLKIFSKRCQWTFISELDLSIKHYLHTVLIFYLISPVLFLLLKISYAHHDELLINIIKQQGSLLIFMINFIYLYLFYNRKHFRMDLWLAVPSLFFQFLLIYLTMGTYYNDLHYISDTDSLYIKYILLLNLQFVLLYQYYWLAIRVLEISKVKLFFMVYSILVLFIMVIGLYGYVDMAINLDFTIILTFILFTWIILLSRFRKIIIYQLKLPGKSYHKKFQALLNDDYPRVMIYLEILVNFIYFILFFQFIIITLISNLWFYSIDVVYSWYELLYHEHSIGNYNFVLINHFYALACFLSLNIINYFASHYFANQLLDNQTSIAKTAKLFYWLGFIVIIMICSMVAGLNFQNMLLIFGALLLGISFSMKNILLDLFAGVLIFINRPFETGDLINIAQQKGFVYKMGLLETVIKNLDKDIVIIPNQFVASSIIENFTFKDKNTHAIHLTYRVNHLQAHDESLIKDMVIKVLQNEKQVVKINEEYVQCILSPDITSPGTYQIELIIFLKNLKTLITKSNDLSIKILTVLNHHHLQAQFIGMTHALNH